MHWGLDLQAASVLSDQVLLCLSEVVHDVEVECLGRGLLILGLLCDHLCSLEKAVMFLFLEALDKPSVMRFIHHSQRNF